MIREGGGLTCKLHGDHWALRGGGRVPKVVVRCAECLAVKRGDAGPVAGAETLARAHEIDHSLGS